MKPKISLWLSQLFLLLYFVTILGPVFWVIVSSFKSPLEFFTNPLGFPQSWLTMNYVHAWTNANIGSAFLNSLVVTCVSVPVVVLLTAMTTFALTRIKFRGRWLLVVLFMSGLMIPKALVLVSLFILLQNMHLVNTINGLVLSYIAFGFPFVMLIQIPFFNNIPAELEEATTVDGGNLFHIFWYVALPLVRNGLIISGIMQFFLVWGEFVLAYSIIYSPELQTLPLAIAYMVTREQYQANWGVLFAGFVISLGPLVFLYAVFHRWITGGLLSGSLKG